MHDEQKRRLYDSLFSLRENTFEYFPLILSYRERIYAAWGNPQILRECTDIKSAVEAVRAEVGAEMPLLFLDVPGAWEA